MIFHNKLFNQIIIFTFIFLISAFSSSSRSQAEPRYTYYENDFITMFYKTGDLELYKKLLPDVFEMPDEPLVMAFFADYYKMDKATQPYLEAAIYLLAKYKGRLAWHCLAMPVTTDEARLGGIYYLGYPKIMGDITLRKTANKYMGVLKLNGKTVMTITHNTKGHEITAEERDWFQKLKAIPDMNILNGKVLEVKTIPQNDGQYSLLDISRMFPDKLELKVGRANISLNPEDAGDYSRKLVDIFSIKPSNIVLAYYYNNKFKYNLGKQTNY